MNRLILLTVIFFCFGCQPSFNPSLVRPRAGSPESMRVEQVSVPYDASLPIYVLSVEPVSSRDQVRDKLYGNVLSAPFEITHSVEFEDAEARERAAMLVSSLYGVGNFKVAALGQGKSVVDALKLKGQNVEGPYIVRASLADWTANAQSDSSKLNVPLAYSGKQSFTQGVVTLDVQVEDQRSGTIAASYVAQGAYFNSEQSEDVSVVVPITERKQTAKSTFFGAQRAAFNKAATELFSLLNRK